MVGLAAGKGGTVSGGAVRPLTAVSAEQNVWDGVPVVMAPDSSGLRLRPPHWGVCWER